jgi:hypothetical protein
MSSGRADVVGKARDYIRAIDAAKGAREAFDRADAHVGDVLRGGSHGHHLSGRLARVSEMGGGRGPMRVEVIDIGTGQVQQANLRDDGWNALAEMMRDSDIGLVMVSRYPDVRAAQKFAELYPGRVVLLSRAP